MIKGDWRSGTTIGTPTIIDDPLEWTFERIENRKLNGMIERALYPGIVADLDVEKIASVLPALKQRGFEMREEGKRLDRS